MLFRSAFALAPGGIVMRYLLDTNAISEVRKRERGNRGFQNWASSNQPSLWALSAVTVGEIRKGIEGRRSADPVQARNLERWLNGVLAEFADQFLPVTLAVAERWGRLAGTLEISDADGLIAATALEHDLTLITRNVSDFAGTGVRVINPWK